ncbi:hypothetical protein BVC80_1583g9 [Macleaya cordata]|uniref:Uncharacterized protein n=1 Tax=Macleaya cordata TaxID=56857 RepID=A0A200QLD8_MACCD|nr:hypothetical protein BVC80_1583g9 [Macleaya cordata]
MYQKSGHSLLTFYVYFGDSMKKELGATHVRGSDDVLNSVLAGFGTGTLLKRRGGRDLRLWYTGNVFGSHKWVTLEK